MSTDAPSPIAVAGYMANALRKAHAECAWPETARGTASNLLIQDLSEFAAVMVAAANANYWSPVWALERLWIERIEVLAGALVDDAFAKRYIESATKPADPVRPGKPRTRARPEDAAGIFASAATSSIEEVNAYRDALLLLKTQASDWFVHPTSMGPLMSKAIQGEQNDGNSARSQLIELLTAGCFWTIMSASRCGIASPVEILKAFDGGRKVADELGSPSSSALADIWEEIVARSAPLPDAAPSPP